MDGKHNEITRGVEHVSQDRRENRGNVRFNDVEHSQLPVAYEINHFSTCTFCAHTSLVEI